MHMKPTTTINLPIMIVGTNAYILNLVKALVTLQDGGDKLPPRGGTLVHAAPVGVAVQTSPTVTTGSL
jgi:hypothetical protein